jgi:hypothetical protein
MPTIKKESTLLRFVFDPSAGGSDQHVYISDGVRYRIQPLSSAVNTLLTSAGAPPIYHVTGVVPGWTLEETITALCGTLDPGELPEPTE